MQEICLPEIYVADMLGVFLILNSLASGAWRLQKKNQEDKILLGMLLTTLLACIADAVTVLVNGVPGSFAHFIAFASNFVLFFANLVIGPFWVLIISNRIHGKVSKSQQWLVLSIFGLGFLLLLANFFAPVYFGIDETNVYSRGILFWLNNAIEAIFMLDGVIIYLIGWIKSGKIKFFPLLQFFWPVSVCMMIQNLFYGISAIWVGIAVGLNGMMSAMQNENVFVDKLTRLFNRYYLDKIIRELRRQEKVVVMMLDMNGFKSINDTYGHSVGDDALFCMAEILRKSLGSKGTAVRYAGDEFVVVLNTNSLDVAKIFKERILENMDGFNESAQKEYNLSASIGMGVFDLKKCGIDDVLEIIDKRMYEDKRNYYAARDHDRRMSRSDVLF